jgi:hypothetical protein
MRLALFFSLSFFPILLACSTESEPPTDTSDPGYLPTGTYALSITAASCSVNRGFRSAERVALIRNPPNTKASVSIPIPATLAVADVDMPRQEVDLTKKHVDLENATIDVTALTHERISIDYREIANGEEQCSVTYDFALVEAACPRDCISTGATLFMSPSGQMSWQCECE